MLKMNLVKQFSDFLSARMHRAGIWRSGALALAYASVLAVAHYLAFQLRFDFQVPEEWAATIWPSFLVTLPLKLLALLVFGQYSALLRYFGMPDLWRVLSAIGLSSVCELVASNPGFGILPIPRGVILSDFVLSSAAIVLLRVLFRLYGERRGGANASQNRGIVKRVGIVGAGDVGASLAKELLAKRGLGMRPVAFFDDDPDKWDSKVHGIPVLGRPEMVAKDNVRAILDEVVIAMPQAPARRIGEVVKVLQHARLKFETVPSVDQLATGKVRVTNLRPVQIQDLLPREIVHLETEKIRELIHGSVVMVTGGGGSIGCELCRQIANHEPRKLIVLDQSEVQLFQAQQELAAHGVEALVVPVIADVKDTRRLERVLKEFRPSLVFHAAAHKHVPLMEYQPGEALKNNTIATAMLADLVLQHGADCFVLVSTDKAVNPTSVMGASKRLAEMYVQSLAAANPNGTRMMAVRFGNVLGSSGSVVPIFTRQIALGGPVTVTHPEVSRYFMTIPEAVGLVLQTAAIGESGAVYALEMGRPVKIVDLARQLIELSGLKVGEDIEIQFTGLRPGEKLTEELSHSSELYRPTQHPQIRRFEGVPLPLPEVRRCLERLGEALEDPDVGKIKLLIKEMVPEYTPFLPPRPQE